MLEQKKQRLIEYWESSKLISDKAVIGAFRKVPRELFVPGEFKEYAYDDSPLPVPGGQTISQPTTVVIMLDELEVRPGMKILEIGAGSGYNAALLGTLVGSKGRIFSLEIVPELVKFARENLRKAKINNVRVILSDGSAGYEKEAPFDRIVCTAGTPEIPKALAGQLREGGILLIPVGFSSSQNMIKARKVQGRLVKQNLGSFAFVPLRGKFGINSK